jgi:cell division protein FtsW
MPRGPAAATAKRTAQPLEYRLLLTVVLCLLAGGAVMVYSASSAPAALQGQGDGTGYLVKYVGYGAVGLGVMWLLARGGLQLAVRWTMPLLILSFVLLVAVRVPHLGVSVNGAQRWLGAGPLQFQPSEIAKLALVLYGATMLARKPGRPQTPADVWPLVIVGLVMAGLVAMQPDLGTALVISFTVTAMLVAAGTPARWIVIGLAVGAGAVLLFALAEPYRRDRLMSFMDPWAHATSTGFQAVQGQIAIGSGGLFGKGIGQGTSKLFYLPEAHTDFILAIIGEELGVFGIGVLLTLYGLVGYAGLRIARNAQGEYAKLVATGITCLVMSQATLNIFTVLGLAPLTGVPLPFISYGATSLVVLLAGMGLLLNVASGATVHVRAVPNRPRVSRPRPVAHDQDRDRRRRNGGTRRTGAGGGRRAAG